MTNPLVPSIAVIIPFYNDQATVGRALASVAAQTRPPSLVLVVDDCSEAGAATALARLVEEFGDLPVRLFRLLVNSGPSAARNFALERADADLIAFLDADDAWHPDKLQIQATLLGERPDLGLIGTLGKMAGPDEVPCQLLRPISTRQQLLRNRFVTSSVMLRGNLDARFNTNLRYSEDNDLWCRLLLSGVGGGVLQDSLTYYFKPSRSPHGASGRYFQMLKGQIRVFIGLERDDLISGGWVIVCIGSAVLRFVRRMTLVVLDRVRIGLAKAASRRTEGCQGW